MNFRNDADIEQNFEQFLSQLRANQPREWEILLSMFRQRIIPWLHKKTGPLPAHHPTSKNAFIEEVYANSLYKFFELFKTGTFKKIGDLRGLMFEVADFKLKEGFRSIKRDQKIYFTEDVGTVMRSEADEFSEAEKEKKELLKEVKKQVNAMSKEDKGLLIRYANGEKLHDIAESLGISASVCRKRKQRALGRLKKRFFNSLKMIVGFVLMKI